MRLVAFDSETTGLLAASIVPPDRQPRLVELAVQDVDSGDAQQWLINPGIPIPHEAARVHKIYDKDVQDAPKLEDVADEIRAWLEGAEVVVAHNAAFDKGVIDANYARIGAAPIKWPTVRCTVEETQHRHGFRLNLTKLHEELGLGKFRAHRAGDDVAALVNIVKALEAENG